MVATVVKRIKHSKLCVTGVYLGDITNSNMIFVILHFNVSCLHVFALLVYLLLYCFSFIVLLLLLLWLFSSSCILFSLHTLFG